MTHFARNRATLCHASTAPLLPIHREHFSKKYCEIFASSTQQYSTLVFSRIILVENDKAFCAWNIWPSRGVRGMIIASPKLEISFSAQTARSLNRLAGGRSIAFKEKSCELWANDFVDKNHPYNHFSYGYPCRLYVGYMWAIWLHVGYMLAIWLHVGYMATCRPYAGYTQAINRLHEGYVGLKSLLLALINLLYRYHNLNDYQPYYYYCYCYYQYFPFLNCNYYYYHWTLRRLYKPAASLPGQFDHHLLCYWV